MMFRDTTLTAKAKRREIYIYLACFAGAMIMNVYGIIKYGSPARELVTQLHVVLIVSLLFYGITVLLRVLYYLIAKLWIRK